MVKNHNFGFSKNHLIFGYFGQKNCRQWPPQIAKMTTNQHIWSQCCERLTQVIESKNILKKTCFFYDIANFCLSQSYYWILLWCRFLKLALVHIIFSQPAQCSNYSYNIGWLPAEMDAFFNISLFCFQDKTNLSKNNWFIHSS